MIMEEHGYGFQVNFRISSSLIDWVTLSIIVPESVKIYADRVVENVVILCDSIECIAMPATDSNFMKEHVSAQPAKLPELGVSSSSGVKPSAAPPASDPE